MGLPQAFKVYLSENEASSCIIKVPGSRIRKRTQLNIASAADLLRELQLASYSGILRSKVYQESQFTQRFISELEDVGQLVGFGDRLYAGEPISAIPGISQDDCSTPEDLGAVE